MRRGLAIGGTTAAIAVAAGAALIAGGGGSDADAQEPSTGTATTEIVRQDLVETQSADGTLEYAGERTVTSVATGTVTWLPAVGSTVERGERLFQVDEKDVYLLDGTVPAWRTLAPGLTGEDVRQLERNLRRLGYDEDHDIELDRSWDAGTTAAVQRWQEDHGMEETGSIELGRIVFLPDTRRIAARGAAVGGPAAGQAPILTTTSTRKIVSVALETAYAELAQVGAKVAVELPSGDRVDGRVTSVGKVASLPAGDDVEASDATVDVTIRFTGDERTPGLDRAPVDVEFERSRAKDVLAVPVTALMAQSGGGFAVEVREGGGRRIVPVETGLYTSSYVEIAGDGLREGMRVTNAEL